MEQFPHLKFIQKIIGKPRLFGGGAPNEYTEANKNDRQGHSKNLSQRTSKIKEDWAKSIAEREAEGLAPLDLEVIPIFFTDQSRFVK